MLQETSGAVAVRSSPAFQDSGVCIYEGDSLAVLDAIAANYPEGRFDMVFADPPYFLSNGGVTCHAGRMVSVHKGDWDKSRGADENHAFNRAWLAACVPRAQSCIMQPNAE